MPPLRRILVASQPLDGGVAKHVVGLVETLPRDRFVVDVACPRESLVWESLAGSSAVELHAIGSHRGPHPGDTISALALLPLAARADVIHVHSAKAGFLGRFAAALRRRRENCVFSPHGWSWWAASGREAALYVRLERLAARWCRTIVTLSGQEREAGLRAGVGRPEQYVVVPNGVDLDRYRVPRAPVRGRILMVGRLAPPKRPDLALRALAELRTRIPEAELVLVGDGPLRPNAEALASELGLGESVSFLGKRDDVAPLLAETDCALLASDYEGCPLAVIEAMAAGVPVVATGVGGVPELVERGRTGIVTAPGDAAALAAGLEEVLGNPGRARTMGVAGRRVAEERLSLPHMVDRLVALYEEVGRTPMVVTRSRD